MTLSHFSLFSIFPRPCIAALKCNEDRYESLFLVSKYGSLCAKPCTARDLQVRKKERKIGRRDSVLLCVVLGALRKVIAHAGPIHTALSGLRRRSNFPTRNVNASYQRATPQNLRDDRRDAIGRHPVPQTGWASFDQFHRHRTPYCTISKTILYEIDNKSINQAVAKKQKQEQNSENEVLGPF